MARQLIEGSFLVEQEVAIARPRDAVFDLLLEPDSWWNSPMEGGRTLLEAHVGGRFFCQRPAGDGRLWAHITHLERPSLLRLSGPLAMDTPVASVFQYELREQTAGTALRLTHRAVGIINPEWRQSHAEGWASLLARLRAAAER